MTANLWEVEGWPVGVSPFEVRVMELQGELVVDQQEFRGPVKLSATAFSFYLDVDHPEADLAAYCDTLLDDEDDEDAEYVAIGLLEPALVTETNVAGSCVVGQPDQNLLLHEFEYSEPYTMYTAVLWGVDGHQWDSSPTERRAHQPRRMFAQVRQEELVLLEVLTGRLGPDGEAAAYAQARGHLLDESRPAGYYAIDASAGRAACLRDMATTAVFQYVGHANAFAIGLYDTSDFIGGERDLSNGAPLTPLDRMRLAVLLGCDTATASAVDPPSAERFRLCGAECSVGWSEPILIANLPVFAEYLAYLAYDSGVTASDALRDATWEAHLDRPDHDGILSYRFYGDRWITVDVPRYQPEPRCPP